MQSAKKTIFSFGEFELDPLHRLLLNRGKPVALKSKTFDLLLTLIEHRGEVVSKNDLLDRVWNNQFVEENNLTVHVAALRKALGETKSENRFIVTVPGKGYKFVADVDAARDVEIVVESHKHERFTFDEEIEVETDEAGVAARDGSAGVNERANSVRKSAMMPFSRQTSVGWIRSNRNAAISVAVIAVLAAIAGGYAVRERFSATSGPAPFVGHSVRQLTTNGKVGLATLSPDGKLFAYTIDDLGQKSLWLGYVAGGNQLLLRPAAEASYRTVVFAPDGKDIYFSLRDEKNPNFTLYRMPVFGGPQQKLLDDVGNFSLSPDGKQIAIGRTDKESGRQHIVVAQIDGSERHDVASFPKDRPFIFSTISWSPDGSRLATNVVRDTAVPLNELAIIEIANGAITRLPIENLREITKTAWLSDGSGLLLTAVEKDSFSSVPQYQIFHVSYPDGETDLITADRSNYGASWHNDAGATLSLSATSDLLLTVEHRQLNNVWVAPSSDLSAARQITFSSFGKYDGLWGLDWTPDGKLIYTTSDTQSQFLSQMDADGGNQKPLTSPGFYDSVLTVSTDGRYVLFHSNRGINTDIWRMDADGSNAKQLTFGGKGYAPAPSPNGRWVYYKSGLSGIGELCRVPLDGGDAECLNDKETSWISFSPDGRYFAASYVTDKGRLAIFSAETNQIIRQFDLPKTATLYMGSRWTADGKAVTYRDTSFGYWIQPVDGGEPHRLEGLPREKLYNFSWSRDGNMLAFVRGQEIRDVVLFAQNR